LSECGSWTRTNEVITNAVIPLFEYLDVNDIERIIETIASLPGLGMAPVGHLSYSAGPNM
jgi:hypothetical protein